MDSSTTLLGFKAIQGAFSILAAMQLTAIFFSPQFQIQDCACFDFIIVGAGSAGSVIANRLTEIANVTVLLIEAGGNPTIESVVPGLFPYLKNTSVDWRYVTEDDGYSLQFHKNHGVNTIRGKMLGGCSSINDLIYARGNYHDFDNWANLTGDDSWNWKNVLPIFKRSERLVDPFLKEIDGGAFHGFDGYLGTIRYYNSEVLKYFEALKELGHAIVYDSNGANPLAYAECMFTIADHLRQSTAQSFLSPAKNRTNLFVLKNTLVSKILFDNNKNAIGVEAILENNKTVSFKAKKEVIVSAGAINTPQLLMLSGIGPREHLRSLNIPVLSDLPVGQHLQDHVMVFTAQTIGNSTPSKPIDITSFPYPLIVGYASLNKSQGYPDYQTFSLVLNQPDPILQFCTYFGFMDDICDDLYKSCIGKEVFYSAVYYLQPESRGKILLRSKNPKEQPTIYTGYYSKEIDLDKHATYVEDFLKLHNSSLFKSVQSQIIVPKICGCGDFNPSHDFWKCFSLCMMCTGFHFAGSCPMGVVVDPRLNVFGVQKLRVADASVMPIITSGNTNAPTIMIGERAADFIKEDYYLNDC